MEDVPRYLTKSRFALAVECPTKLFYTGKAEYANRKLEDPFLEALAEGGFQVGELARRYFSGGVMVEELRHRKAEGITAELMQHDSVVLYEPAFRFGNLFIRADILVKDGKNIQLVEVKAKSWNPGSDKGFLTNKGNIRSEWKSYLYDVAFQTYVLRNALPGFTVEPFLMLADKSAKCPTDGLNQKLRIRRDANNRKGVVIFGELTPEDLDPWILAKVPVGEIVDAILRGDAPDFSDGFGLMVQKWADAYAKDERIPPEPGSRCKDCEFKATEEEIEKGLKCGFRVCWEEAFGLSDADFGGPSVLDIWNFRNKDQYLGQGAWKIEAVLDDLDDPDGDGKPGLSNKQRQRLQVEKAASGDGRPYLDRENLSAAMGSWKYPLHFIDFETSMPAVPFNRGKRPYEGIAFQFSHHVVEMDGTVRHEGQFLETQPGVFPNYKFLRALKEQLDGDEGTIFRYAHHENTYLRHIYDQLSEDPSPPSDAEELMNFINEITEWKIGKKDKQEGPRNMVDLLQLVKRYYYDLAMGGSNSIKVVLPAVLNASPFLQEKYGKPVYGAEGGIQSLNFKDWTWVRFEKGRALCPYSLLPEIFEGVTDEELEQFVTKEDDGIREGGAAMMAWAAMQFSDMGEGERERITKALLKYCELDTLAMVMIYEGWKDMTGTV